MEYEAIFSISIIVNSNNTTYGTVSGGTGVYTSETTKTLTATPKKGYSFSQWSDGNTENPRSISITENKTYTAIFVGPEFETQNTNNAIAAFWDFGSVNIGEVASTKIYLKNTGTATGSLPRIYIQDGYNQFSFNENMMLTELTTSLDIDIDEDASFNIYYKPTSAKKHSCIIVFETSIGNYAFTLSGIGISNNPIHTITVVANNTNYGTVIGGGKYEENSEVILSATAKNGYKFSQWNDGSKQNPRMVTATEDASYTAIFVKENADALAEATGNNAQIFGGEKRIVVNNAANAMVAIYDVMGRTVVKEQRINSNNEVFAVPQTGIYIVRMGKAAKKVFVK